MIKIVLKKDALSKENEIHHACTIGNWLTQNYASMPEHLRIFHSYSDLSTAEISFANECTPKNQTELQALDLLPGTFIVIENPKGLAAIISVVVSLVVAVATFFLMPTPTIAATKQNNNTSTSPNNELASRQNQTRINQRIPDIYGEVWSTPDLIAVPYTVYENNVEVEHITGVIGRGRYEIKDVFDGDTRIVDIAGATVEVYRPDENIATGHAYYREGTKITSEPLAVQKQTSVNGQVLRPTNTKSLTGSNDISFKFPNEIVATELSGRDFTASFLSNDVIQITNASFTHNAVTYSLNGTYKVLSVSNRRIALSNPASVNAAWNVLEQITNQQTSNLSPTLASINDKWIGPFILDGLDRAGIMANFVAQNGLYKSNGTSQTAVSVNIEVEVTPVDENDQSIGNSITQTITMQGSEVAKETIGVTLNIPTFLGRCSVRARRASATDSSYAGSVVDEVKWSALYGFSPMKRLVYENCTVVRARSYATTGALAVKERKLNMLVQRELRTYVNGELSLLYYPSSSYADALVDIALDQKIGRLSLEEIDLENIYNTQADIESYFGTEEATQFCTTLDDSNLSFEETVKLIADACFLTIYRQGNVLKTFFERKTSNSSLLFNCRNRVPDTEEISINFGISDDYDGIIYEWTDPKDDSRVNIYLPSNAVSNPKEIKSVGVRNRWQAHFNAHRLWNKLKFQTKTLKFDACAEAELLILRDRVLYARQTDQCYQSGEVVSQDGLILELSEHVSFVENTDHYLSLQMPDGTIDSIQCTPGEDEYHVVLDRIPLKPLSVSYRNQVRSTFVLVPDNDTKNLAYLCVERSSSGVNTHSVTLVNYDDRYYANDFDFSDEPEVDLTPIRFAYDMLDINLANVYRSQRGELPSSGDVYFEVNSGVLISSSSAARPEYTNYYRLKSQYPVEQAIYPARPEIPAIKVGEWPSAVNIYLTVKGTVCGRGGDGGVGQCSTSHPYENVNPPYYAQIIQRRDGHAGAPGIENSHPNFHIIIDGGTVARGGSGGGASPCGGLSSSNGATGSTSGAIGGGGVPYGGILSGVIPIEEPSESYYGWGYYAPFLQFRSEAGASKTAPGLGYRTQWLGDSTRYSDKSGNGGAMGRLGAPSMADGSNAFVRWASSPQGLAGPGGAAIIGTAPASITMLNNGQILQTV